MFLNTDSKFIWMNGDFQPFNNTNIHLLSNTLHYGMGVFEGVRAYETKDGGAMLRLIEHALKDYLLQHQKLISPFHFLLMSCAKPK